jgi:hypothetical protein
MSESVRCAPKAAFLNPGDSGGPGQQGFGFI